MALIKNFRELNVYKAARIETQKIYLRSRSFPPEERYSLTDQIRRSSRAVKAMVAEAWARRRYRAVFINKIDEALGRLPKLNHGWMIVWIAVTFQPKNFLRWMLLGKASARC